MNDIINMNHSQSIGISARGRALGFGRALGPWALGPGLGPGRRFPMHNVLAAAQGPPKGQEAPAPTLMTWLSLTTMTFLMSQIIQSRSLQV